MPIGKAVEEFNATDPLVLAVEQVWDAGIVVVIAAGNYGRDGHMTITSPCPMPDGLRCGVTLAPADENQSNRMSMIRTTTILIALLMASTVAAANSDGYFCVGPDYFAYQLVRWDAGDKQDLYVIAFTEWLGNFNQSKTELPSFQIH